MEDIGQLPRCPFCNGDGWVAIPKWADTQKQKVRILKVRCRCGIEPPLDEPGVITADQLDRLDGEESIQ
jgi:hypothetical protein